MLGFAPLAAAPLGSTGSAAFVYTASVAEATAVSALLQVQANLSADVTISAFTASSTSVAPSVFSQSVASSVGVLDVVTGSKLITSYLLTGVLAEDAQLAQASFNSASENTAQAEDLTYSGADYNIAIANSATGSDSASAKAAFNSELPVESTSVADEIAAVVDFSALLLDGLSALDSNSATAGFAPLVQDGVIASSNTAISSAEISATAADGAYAASELLVGAAYFVSMEENVIVLDEAAAFFPWAVIDDDQSANWSSIQTAQASAWGVVDDNQTNPWRIVPTQS